VRDCAAFACRWKAANFVGAAKRLMIRNHTSATTVGRPSIMPVFPTGIQCAPAIPLSTIDRKSFVGRLLRAIQIIASCL